MLATIVQLPVLMSIGVGIALNNSRGCIEALLGHASDFVRTPKYNTLAPDQTTGNDPGYTRRVIPTPSIKTWMLVLEIGMGLYTLECARLAAFSDNALLSTPFLLLFSFGYLYVGLTGLLNQRLAGGATPQPAF